MINLDRLFVLEKRLYLDETSGELNLAIVHSHLCRNDFLRYSNIQKTFQDMLLMTTTAALYNYLWPVSPAGYVAILLCSAVLPSDNINYSRR